MINWKPFSTAPKDRPFYAYSEREGIATLKWEEPPPFHIWKAAFKRKPNAPADRGTISHSSIYPDSWSHWCEIDEIKPRLNLDQYHDIALRLNKIKSQARNYIDHFQDDMRRG